MLGLNFLVIKLYPMRPGATMMSSFLINTALILIMSPAIIQFCAQAFAVYANNTSIFDVFGNQVMFLMGVRFIYNFNIFLYILLAVITVSSLFMAIRCVVRICTYAMYICTHALNLCLECASASPCKHVCH